MTQNYDISVTQTFVPKCFLFSVQLRMSFNFSEGVCNESVLVTYLIVVTDYYNCIFPDCLSLPYLGISAGDSIQVTSQIKSPFVD
jgi:hypothetical protein